MNRRETSNAKEEILMVSYMSSVQMGCTHLGINCGNFCGLGPISSVPLGRVGEPSIIIFSTFEHDQRPFLCPIVNTRK
jgi:hypothetical protein